MLKLMKIFGKSLSDESFWEKFDLTNSEIKEVQNDLMIRVLLILVLFDLYLSF